MDCHLHEKHEIKCPTNKNDFTAVSHLFVGHLIFIYQYFVGRAGSPWIQDPKKYLKENI